MSGFQKLKVKMSKLGDVLSKLVQLKRITNEGVGPKPQKLGIFLKIPNYFNAIEIHSARVQTYLSELDY